MPRTLHPRVSRRKMPRQERARVTVRAVVEGTVQVLRERGYEGATLQRIAARAGVSVGSIYQYFPSKEALFAAVLEQHLDEMRTELVERMAATVDQPFAARVRALVDGALRAHARDPVLHRVLVEELPRVGRLDRHRQVLDELREAVLALLEAHAAEVRAGPSALIATVLVAAIDAATHTLVVDRPELLGEEAIDELTRLALRYAEAP